MTNNLRCLSAWAVILGQTLIAPMLASAQERGPAGTVTLSRTDYDRLLDLAAGQPRPPDGAPLPAALTRADLRVRVAAGSVRATMTVDGEVFQTGAVKVPLISQATLLDARTGERPLPLIAEGNAHVAIVTGPATFSATLDWGAAVTTSPGPRLVRAAGAPGREARPRRSTSLASSPTCACRLAWWSGGPRPPDARSSRPRSIPARRRPSPGRRAKPGRPPHRATPACSPDIKSLVTIGDADVRLLALVDLTIVQGEPAAIEVRLPAGYELVGVTGSSLERSEPHADRVVLFVTPATRRRHQFLLNLERSSAGGSFTVDTGFPTIPAVQRETGEVAVEGVGTLEITSQDVPGLRRMDVREVDAALASAARQALLAAFRYQRGPSGPPALALNVTRFPDAAVLAAIAERAVATTLVTREGRALTEVSLLIRNRAQPFMKVVLPAGASMLSVDIAGSPAKPADGADGMRVPLLRAGFRPDGPYTVSFVYLHAGTAFARKGDMQMTLPRMDVPISVVEWELFLPGDYRADRFSGSAIAAHLIEPAPAVGGLTETVTVSADTPMVDTSTSARQFTANEPGRSGGRGGQGNDDARRESRDEDVAQLAAAPSANVQSLQRRAAGVLPVRIDVPRAGTSHRFLKPLVIDEETIVQFRYCGGDGPRSAMPDQRSQARLLRHAASRPCSGRPGSTS